MNLNELVEKSHKMAVDKGFWEANGWNSVPTKLMLIVSELGEACEADRCGDMDGLYEELADTFIRLADLCGALEIDIEKEIERKMEINRKRGIRHGKKY